ncbi:MAG: NrdH-redoxin [Synergistales bacterium]|nr:NrdH-redoxin [Synergistales bacterium]
MVAVKVYSTSACPWCRKAKEYLASQNVEYEDVDVGADREAAMEMVRNTRQMGVPVIAVGDRYIVGFDKPAIDAALREEGLGKE